MNDLILYRGEWYTVNQYLKGSVMLEDEIGNLFHVKDRDIQIPSSSWIVHYA